MKSIRISDISPENFKGVFGILLGAELPAEMEIGAFAELARLQGWDSEFARRYRMPFPRGKSEWIRLITKLPTQDPIKVADTFANEKIRPADVLTLLAATTPPTAISKAEFARISGMDKGNVTRRAGGKDFPLTREHAEEIRAQRDSKIRGPGVPAKPKAKQSFSRCRGCGDEIKPQEISEHLRASRRALALDSSR